MNIRKRFRFVGTVQGVGFRWRARQAATFLHLTGWVRNEWDGSVVMEVQGSEHAVDQIVGTIDGSGWIHIDGIESERLPVDPEEKSFKVIGY